MQFQRMEWATAVEEVASKINKALEDGPVLLLLSGGSNIKTGTVIRQHLNFKNPLTVSLIDERYGAPGHSDSNWQALIDAGFDTKKLQILPVLEGEPIEETTNSFKGKLRQAFQTNSAIIGIFGIGTDGHTSGILPHSAAVDASEIVVHYDGPDYRRITTTPLAFRSFDAAFLFAYGENKRQQLERLSQELPIAEQPAQALKSIPELIIYNDQIGDL